VKAGIRIRYGHRPSQYCTSVAQTLMSVAVQPERLG